MTTAHRDQHTLNLVPLTLKRARELVQVWHRHHQAPQGGLFAVGVECGGALCGVAIVGRPVARRLDDGRTAEVTRVATDGTYNACSKLYAACRAACRALGYARLITYTLETESGASLRAAGFIDQGVAGGGSWSRPSRQRDDPHPLIPKRRWEWRRRDPSPGG